MQEAGGARQALIIAAEKLFAERGIDEVSMRDVAAAAGQRNNSAVQYHFGSREELLRQVLWAQSVEVNRDRRVWLDRIIERGQVGDVRALVETAIMPSAEYVRSGRGGRFHARFLVRVSPMVELAGEEFRAHAETVGIEPISEIMALLVAVLPFSSRQAAGERVGLVMNMASAGLANAEARLDDGPGQPPTSARLAAFDKAVVRLIDVVVGALMAADTSE